MIKKATNLEQLLIDTRKRWLEAKRKGDTISMALFEKIGLSTKAKIMEKSGVVENISEPATNEQVENIFGGKLQETS